MQFSTQDIEQIKALGIDPKQVEIQLERFKNGFPELTLSGNVNANKGLRILSEVELKQYIAVFDRIAPHKDLVKFVPASGAASRMFKLLFNYVEGEVDKEDEGIQKFFAEIENFAFVSELKQILGENAEILIDEKDKKVVEALLNESGLNYGKLPKALLTFHNYEESSTKAIDEHLIEGFKYCLDNKDVVNLHFTVSEEHMELIKQHLDKVVPVYERKFGNQYVITFSVQDQATNTLAVDMENNPFRMDDETLLFRPGGHGALLKNLNEMDADVVFIKNIDNVAANWLIQDTVDYKKALGGVLLETQISIFNYCEELEDTEELTLELENSIVSFLNNKLGYKVAPDFSNLAQTKKAELLLNKLNRPLRICGVVESSGTGGGPFWVQHADGSETLQLVETDQVNKNNPEQLKILGSSNYANITDLFCGLRNYKGEKFDLMKFRDPDTGFISHKSLNGKALKAMELPGLWNGAMSDWNTCFVQVPMSTFNPVKTVLDLLKKEHQGK